MNKRIKNRRFNRTTAGMAVTIPSEDSCEQAHGRLVGVELGGVTREPCCREGVCRSSGRETRRSGLRRRSGSATATAVTTECVGRIRSPVRVGRVDRRRDRPGSDRPPKTVGELRWSSERPNQDGLGWCPSGAGKRSAGTRRGDHRRACRLADVLEDRPYRRCLYTRRCSVFGPESDVRFGAWR